MKKSGGIVRVAKRENGYAIIDPYFLSDERLTWKAKGILSYLLSKPSNWKVYISDLIKRSKDGRDAVYSAMKELEGAGYIERRQIRDEQERVEGIETIVYERPLVDYCYAENPDTEEPLTENPPLVINDLNKIDSKKEKDKNAATAEKDNLQTLAKVLKRLPLNDTSSLYDHYFEDIYAMLTRRFGDQLEPEAIEFAGERYFQKAIDMPTGLPKSSVYSPTGVFYDCYLEGAAELKAKRYRERTAI